MSTHRVLLFALLVACGGGGDTAATDAAPPAPDAETVALGVDRGTYLDEMTGDELAALCEWMVAVQGGPHTEDCGNGVKVTIDPVSECIATPEWPHCTVGMIADCVEAQAEDLCADAPPACDTFYTCAFGG